MREEQRINSAMQRRRRFAKIVAAWLAMSIFGAAMIAGTPGHAAEQRRGGEPFGLASYTAPEGALWARWRAIQADIVADAELLAACRADPDGCPSPAAVRFLKVVGDAGRRQGIARLDAVNRALNTATRWQYNVAGLWTAPLATLVAGLGDCMDFRSRNILRCARRTWRRMICGS